MIHTFAGEPLPLSQASRRPRQPRRVQRSTRVATPSSWFVLWVELLAIGKTLGWDSYQAMVSCEWSAAATYRPNRVMTLLTSAGSEADGVRSA